MVREGESSCCRSMYTKRPSFDSQEKYRCHIEEKFKATGSWSPWRRRPTLLSVRPSGWHDDRRFLERYISCSWSWHGCRSRECVSYLVSAGDSDTLKMMLRARFAIGGGGGGADLDILKMKRSSTDSRFGHLDAHILERDMSCSCCHSR